MYSFNFVCPSACQFSRRHFIYCFRVILIAIVTIQLLTLSMFRGVATEGGNQQARSIPSCHSNVLRANVLPNVHQMLPSIWSQCPNLVFFCFIYWFYISRPLGIMVSQQSWGCSRMSTTDEIFTLLAQSNKGKINNLGMEDIKMKFCTDRYIGTLNGG